jgi:hypothetical protein
MKEELCMLGAGGGGLGIGTMCITVCTHLQQSLVTVCGLPFFPRNWDPGDRQDQSFHHWQTETQNMAATCQGYLQSQ